MSINLLMSMVNAGFGAVLEGQRPVDIAFLFRVMWLEGILGDFQSVDGMSREVELYEYQEGGKNDGKHVLPGPVKHGRMTLKTGQMNLSLLYDWCKMVELGEDFRRDMIILQMKRDGIPLRIYAITDAWPISWKAAPLDAGQSAVPIEELTLVYNDLYMVLLPDVI